MGQNQPEIYILDGNEKHYQFQFVLNEEMHRFFNSLPTTNNKRVHVSKETKKKLKKSFLVIHFNIHASNQSDIYITLCGKRFS